MMRKLPSFRSLQSLEAAVRLGSMASAAREMNVTTGAASRQIALLESELGTRVLERTGRGVVPTPQGRELAARLRQAFDMISDEVGRISAGTVDGPLTLNVYPTFAIQWLVPRLADFHGTEPGTDLRIRPTLSEDRFDKPDISAAVCIGRPRGAGLFSLPLFRRRFTPLVGRATAADLAGADPSVLYEATIFYSEMHIRQWEIWLGDRALPPLDLARRGIRFENSSLAYQAAREAPGFTIGQPALVQADLDSGRLVAPFDHVAEGPERYWIACRTRDRHRPDLARLMDWMATQAARTDSDDYPTA